MDDLIYYLSKSQPVDVKGTCRGITEFRAFIDLDYVHVRFIVFSRPVGFGFGLDKPRCSLDACDFEAGSGVAHLEGAPAYFNSVYARIVADINLATLEGEGRFILLDLPD